MVQQQAKRQAKVRDGGGRGRAAAAAHPAGQHHACMRAVLAHSLHVTSPYIVPRFR